MATAKVATTSLTKAAVVAVVVNIKVAAAAMAAAIMADIKKKVASTADIIMGPHMVATHISTKSLSTREAAATKADTSRIDLRPATIRMRVLAIETKIPRLSFSSHTDLIKAANILLTAATEIHIRGRISLTRKKARILDMVKDPHPELKETLMKRALSTPQVVQLTLYPDLPHQKFSPRVPNPSPYIRPCLANSLLTSIGYAWARISRSTSMMYLYSLII